MDQLLEMSAADLRVGLKGRRITAVELMDAVLSRISDTNDMVNAIVSHQDADQLMARARAADQGPMIGALDGLPIAIKDLADTEGVRTTYGSPLFKDHVPIADCGMVARLKAAGAIVIGKTNTPEWGLGSHSYNPVHGVTRNPYDLDRSAGGSSGGAAAALAARMVPLADGSDMMGSLRNPAGWCNVYGFRPSWGRVPADPVGDVYLHRLATEGPMARTVADIHLMLRLMAVGHPRWPEASLPPLGDPSMKDGGRLAWLSDWGGALPMEGGVLDICSSAVSEFEGMGFVVDEPSAAHDLEDIWHSWITLRAFSVAAKLDPIHRDPVKRDHLKPEAIWEIEKGLGLSAMDLQRASLARTRWLHRAVELFETYDALLLPSAQLFPFPASWDWPKDIGGVGMDSYHRWMQVVVPASLLGLPVLSVPAGFHGNLPMGLQIIGAPGADDTVLAIGEAWHRATNWPSRRAPAI